MDVLELEYKYIEDQEEKTTIVRAKERDGSYYIKLMDDVDRNGNVVQKAIKITGKKWQFISIGSDNESAIHVHLLDDGTVKYAVGTKELTIAPDTFDPLLANSDFPYNIAAQMHYLKEQFDYILSVQSQVKAVRKRRLERRLKKLGYKSIEDSLEMLKEHSIYCDFDDILQELESYEDYIEISGFSRREEEEVQGITEQYIVYTSPTEEGRDNIISLFRKVKLDLETEDARLQEKKEMPDRKKDLIERFSIRPLKEFGMTFPAIMSMTEKEWEAYTAYITGVCREYWPKKPQIAKRLERLGITYSQIRHMPEEEWEKLVASITSEEGYEGPMIFEKSEFDPFEFMPEEQMTFPTTSPQRSIQMHNFVWNRYAKGIGKVARLYLSLNADILPAKIAKQVDDKTGEYGVETEDCRAGEDLRALISQCIDSDEFKNACNIEDIAICARNLDFIDYIDELLRDSREKVGDGLVASIMELRDDSVAQIEERMGHVARFNNAQIRIQQLKGVRRVIAPDFEEK